VLFFITRAKRHGDIVMEVEMKGQNPYTIAFGIKPNQYISRPEVVDEIVSTFNSETPPYMACILTGVRGCGKTVALTSIAKEMKDYSRWIMINVNPERDILQTIASALYENPILKPLFSKADINISIAVAGVSIRQENVPVDMAVTVGKMLSLIKAAGKRVLIMLDEVVNNEYVRPFVSQYQIYIREDLPIYLLMTGLYDNISDLQDEKTLTFLYRMPKIVLEPLGLYLISQDYKKVFNISDEEAVEMAKLTKGYSFAFQALGYMRWKYDGEPWDKVLDEYDNQLDRNVYAKLWSELSDRDREVLIIMSEGIEDVSVIRDKLNIKSNQMAVYRRRLIDKGLIRENGHGKVRYCLPRFAEIIKKWQMFE